jgi:hypothetical protein
MRVDDTFTRLPARVRSLASDRETVALVAVFLLGAVFYFWRANYAEPLALHGGRDNPYNQLADAFLHLHLWVVHVPAAALGPGNPYNPEQRSAFLSAFSDYSLYGHYLYIEWGPAPVLTLLVPLHLLGFEPSASVVTMPFAIAGLGFALATLKVILRRIGNVRLWVCVLAALTLMCASVMPYVVRFPLVYYEAVAGGYCFAMAGLWLGASAVTDRRSSLWRLALMSLCIGLATGSRPTLGLLALLFVPVYIALRGARSSRGLLVALLAPFAVCVLLLAAYDQARFGNPLQYGTEYQINGISTYTAHFGELGYLSPGLWAYLIAPPRLSVLFPFLLINYPQVSYPLALPAHYISISEETGGLLSTAPIAVLLVALPWLWRRRPALLGSLAPFLLAMVGAGLAIMAFLAFEFYTSSERYETDYMSLLLFAGLATWLALSSVAKGHRGRLIRVGGGLLAVWSCAAGMGASYQEIEKHFGTWRALVDLGSPLSTVIATVAGHPVLAEVDAGNSKRSPLSYSNIGTEVNGFWLTASNHADVTIVSPGASEDALVANVSAGPALRAGEPLEIRVDGPGRASRVYQLPSAGERARIPVRLDRGVNQIVLSAVGGTPSPTGSAEPESEAHAVMSFANFTLAGG